MVNEIQTTPTTNPLSDLESRVNAARHAAEVAAAMMEFVGPPDGVTDHIVYAVLNARSEAKALYDAFYSSPAWRAAA